MEKNINSNYKSIFVKDKNFNNEISTISNYNELLTNKKESQLISLKKKINKKRFSETSRISPNKIILNTLRICEKVKSKNFLDSKNKMNKLDIIEDTKIAARTVYINNKREKSRIKLIEDFKEFIKSYNQNALIILKNYLSKMINIKDLYSNIFKENEMYQSRISNIDNDVRILKNKLLNYNDEIIKLEGQFKIFKKMIPFFEELIQKFPNGNPQELIKEYFKNKNISIEQLKRLNVLEEKYYEIFNDSKKKLEKENEEKERIQMRIDEENNIYKTRKIIIEDELYLLEKQYENIQKGNESKIKLKKMMVRLYKNIQKYIPEKNYNNFIKKIKYNPIKNEDSFDPSVYHNTFYIELLENCLINKATDCIDGKLLRITIVFANYLARKYLSQNKNKKYRYDPVNSLRDLKSLIDNIKFDNYRLKGMIINLRQKQLDIKIKHKNLENLQKKRKMEYHELLKKLEMAKKVQLKLIKSNHNYLKMFNSAKRNEIIKTKKIIKSHSKLKLKIENNNKNQNIIMNNYKTNSNLFITNMNKILNKNKRKEKSLQIGSSENNLKINRNKIHKYKTKENTDLKTEKDNYKKILRHLKNIKMSKNKDKLFKKNAFNSTGNIFSNIENIVQDSLKQEDLKYFKNTNKNYKEKKGRLSIETYNNYPLSTRDFKNIKDEKKFKTDNTNISYYNQIFCEENYKIISNKIMKNIDNIIFSIKQNNLKNEEIINNNPSFVEIKKEEETNGNKMENGKKNQSEKFEDENSSFSNDDESDNISISF